MFDPCNFVCQSLTTYHSFYVLHKIVGISRRAWGYDASLVAMFMTFKEANTCMPEA